MDVRRLWAAMSAHEYGPEPIVIEVDGDEIEIATASCMNESGQDGLFVSGRGKTLEEALVAFEANLDEQLSFIEDELE